MTHHEEMDSLITVLKHLKNRNQDNELFINEDGRVLLLERRYQPYEIRLIRTYRFEGDSNPGDEAIIYLIKVSDGTIGYSIDAYGMYTNHQSDGYAGLIKKRVAVGHSPVNCT